MRSLRDHDRLHLDVLGPGDRAQAVRLCDSLAQQLFTIGVTAKSARSTAGAGASEALREIEEMAAAARRELRAARALSARAPARPAFEAELESELRTIALQAACRVAVTRHGRPWRLDREVQRLLVDTARETLGHVVGLQRARLAVAHLRYAPDSIALSVQAEHVPTGVDGHADLTGLRVRADRLHGRLEQAPAGGKTPLVRLVLPRGS